MQSRKSAANHRAPSSSSSHERQRAKKARALSAGGNAKEKRKSLSRRSPLKEKRRKASAPEIVESSQSGEEALPPARNNAPPESPRGRPRVRRGSVVAPPHDPSPEPVANRPKRGVAASPASASTSPRRTPKARKQAASASTSPRRTLKAKKQKDAPGTGGEGIELDDETPAPAPRKTKPALMIGREEGDDSDEEGANADDEADIGNASSPASRRKRGRGRSPKKSPARVPAAAASSAKEQPLRLQESDDGSDEADAPVGRRSPRTKKPPRVPPLQELLKTTTVLMAHANAPFTMVQYGGGEGSNAGDAAVLNLRKSRRMLSLDFGGTAGQQKEADTRRKNLRKATKQLGDDSDYESEENYEGKGKDVGDNTHPHEDHIGLQSLATVKVFDRFWVGTAKPDFLVESEDDARALQRIKQKVHEIRQNGEILFSWISKEGKIRRANTKLRVRALAILPNTTRVDDDDPDLNKRSTGALISVDMVEPKGTRRAFTMLTLGDMTPEEGQAAVQNVWQEEDGENTVNVIKMAHHGSDENIDAAPEAVVRAGVTDLVISGYTMKSTAKLIQFIDRTRPRRVLILFNDKKLARYFLSLETVGLLYDNARKFHVEVIVAKDYVITVDDDGNPSLDPSGW